MTVNSPTIGEKTDPFNEIYNVYTTAKIVYFLT